jgi:hypothetical protein
VELPDSCCLLSTVGGTGRVAAVALIQAPVNMDNLMKVKPNTCYMLCNPYEPLVVS